MPNTPTVQLLALVAAIIMLVGGALIVYRWAKALQPSAISR
jgi:H+/Cl- antiporter ClcA